MHASRQPLCMIGDVGGTNIRFAHCALDSDQTAPKLQGVQEFTCANYSCLEDAVLEYQRACLAKDINFQFMCLAIAGPIHSDQSFVMLNNDWRGSAEQLSKLVNCPVRLINDCVATTYTLPYLSDDDRLSFEGYAPIRIADTDNALYAVVSPGTGLGISSLLIHAKQHIPIATEGGHASFAPINELQVELLNYCRKHYERVSNERLLCGNGLSLIYEALAAIRGADSAPHSSSDAIGAAALARSDSLSVDSFNMFCEILGTVAGDIALSCGATEGIFIGGGILPRYSNLLLNSRFREFFENKGRHKDYMRAIPSELIACNHSGMLGSAVCARQTFSALN